MDVRDKDRIDKIRAIWGVKPALLGGMDEHHPRFAAMDIDWLLDQLKQRDEKIKHLERIEAAARAAAKAGWPTETIGDLRRVISEVSNVHD